MNGSNKGILQSYKDHLLQMCRMLKHRIE